MNYKHAEPIDMSSFELYYLLLANEVCSNYISPVSFLCDFLLDCFFRLTHRTFHPQKRGKQVPPRGH